MRLELPDIQENWFHVFIFLLDTVAYIYMFRLDWLHHNLNYANQSIIFRT